MSTRAQDRLASRPKLILRAVRERGNRREHGDNEQMRRERPSRQRVRSSAGVVVKAKHEARSSEPERGCWGERRREERKASQIHKKTGSSPYALAEPQNQRKFKNKIQKSLNQ